MTTLDVTEFSLRQGNGGGFAQRIAVSPVSAPSVAFADPDIDNAIVLCTTSCYVRAGSAPVALSDGTDPYLSVGLPYRVRFPRGSKLAFISTGGTGFAFIIPGG